MSLKKTIGIVSIISLFFISCSELQKKAKEYTPDLRLVDVKMTGFDLAGVDMDFVYEITNKAPFSVTFSRLQFVLKLENKEILSADNKKNISIVSKGTSQFTIAHRVEYVNLGTTLVNIYKKDKVRVDLDGKIGVYLNDLFGSVEVPFEATRDITVPKLPSIRYGTLAYKSANVNILSPTKSNAVFELKFYLKNSNAFAIDIPQMKVNFTAADSKLLQSEQKNLKLTQDKETLVTLPVTIEGAEVATLLPKLRDASNLEYKLNGNMSFRISEKDFNLPYSIP